MELTMRYVQFFNIWRANGKLLHVVRLMAFFCSTVLSTLLFFWFLKTFHKLLMRTSCISNTSYYVNCFVIQIGGIATIFSFLHLHQTHPSCSSHMGFFDWTFLMRNVAYVQIQEIYGEAGVWGFWKGVFPTLIMVCDSWLLKVLMEDH